MSNDYSYVVTPFYTADGKVTTLGRVHARTASGEKMRTAVEQLSGTTLGVKGTTAQRMAVFDAQELIKHTFLTNDWSNPSSLFKMIEEYGRLGPYDSSVVDAEDDPSSGDDGNGDGNDDGDDSSSWKLEAECNRRFNANRALNLVASSEVKRLRIALQHQGKVDKLITTFDSLRKVRAHEGEFLSLLRAYVDTIPTAMQLGVVISNTRDSLKMVKPPTGRTGDFLSNVLLESRRYFCDMDSVLATIGLPPQSDQERYLTFCNLARGTLVQPAVDDYEKHAYRTHATPNLSDLFDELKATYQRRAFIEESTQEPKGDGSKEKPLTVSNVTGGKGGKKRPEKRGEGTKRDKEKKPPNKYSSEQTEAFNAWRKNHADVCYKCEKRCSDKKHFAACTDFKKVADLAPDNPRRVGTEASEVDSGGVFSCRPMTVYRASPAVGHSNTIFDTGAAAGSYVSVDRGFDVRTSVKTNAMIKGIGGGKARVRLAGTVYIRVPALVRLPSGHSETRGVNVRFDAAYTPDLDRDSTNLLGSASFVYDGGIQCMKAANVAEFGNQAVHTAQGDQLLRLGAVHAIKDRVQRIELRLKSVGGLLYFPNFEYLTQGEIERLEPNPPESLTQLGPMLKNMDNSDSEESE